MALKPEEIERYRLILDERRKGTDYPALAMLLGCDLSTAERLTKRAVKALLKDAAEEIRTQELDRLAVLERELWEKARTGVSDRNAVEFDRLLRVISMRLEWSGARPAPLAPVQINDHRLQVVVNHFYPADSQPHQVAAMRTLPAQAEQQPDAALSAESNLAASDSQHESEQPSQEDENA